MLTTATPRFVPLRSSPRKGIIGFDNAIAKAKDLAAKKDLRVFVEWSGQEEYLLYLETEQAAISKVDNKFLIALCNATGFTRL